jgi:GGDEF domain-containing protein
MSERWVLIDHESGLHVGWYFWLRVLDEVNRSARYGSPFGLMLLEAEMEGGAGRHAVQAAVATVPAAIRGTDIGGHLGPGRVGVLLTNQNLDGARVATERVLERISASCPSHVKWDTRLLTYPEDGGEISMLLTTGWPDQDALTSLPA